MVTSSQKRALFNSVLGSLLHDVLAEDPQASVAVSSNTNGRNGRVFFVDAPVGTGTTFGVKAMQALLKLHVVYLPKSQSATEVVLPGSVVGRKST